MEAWKKDLYLAHHGILGQKWGVRRFQNKDGTLTDAGKKRYKIDERGHYVDLTKKKFDRTKNPLADAKQMSDEDLKKARDRATMENVYADQMRKQHVETMPEKVKKIIEESMSKAIKNTIDTGVTRLGNKITEKVLSSVGLGDPNGTKKKSDQQSQKTTKADNGVKISEKDKVVSGKGQESYSMGFNVSSGLETKKSTRDYQKSRDMKYDDSPESEKDVSGKSSSSELSSGPGTRRQETRSRVSWVEKQLRPDNRDEQEEARRKELRSASDGDGDDDTDNDNNNKQKKKKKKND